MIDAEEIKEAAGRLSLDPRVIEKDYVIGWVLAGIYNHPLLSPAWLFKGGTCVKKCFFDTERMSEDLDFTLITDEQINVDFLKLAFAEVSEWVYEQSGINIAADAKQVPLYIDIYENPRGNQACQARIYYRGPLKYQYSAAKIKLDLTADEKLVQPSVRVGVDHPYSDFNPDLFYAQSYSFAELFSEKIRALGERARPGARDLYDVVNLFRQVPLKDSLVLREILKVKCEFKGIGLITLADIEPKKEEFFRQWGQQLFHQVHILPPVEVYWNHLPSFFEWLYSEE
ncbi:MAG: nucleotidyl transferase AbiEii/AbiGii toxin family protein [Alphaproteobacteria bacterium]|nr:nucleotidyl transferase AbiEii/AbiGii toxin family protein [Alphaproteobacteria bacterium]